MDIKFGRIVHGGGEPLDGFKFQLLEVGGKLVLTSSPQRDALLVEHGLREWLEGQIKRFDARWMKEVLREHLVSIDRWEAERVRRPAGPWDTVYFVTGPMFDASPRGGDARIQILALNGRSWCALNGYGVDEHGRVLITPYGRYPMGEVAPLGHFPTTYLPAAQKHLAEIERATASKPDP
jgi:hypothetical protein